MSQHKINLEFPIGLPVSDLEKSASWYEKLIMSDEKLIPAEGVIEYQIGSVWIQLFEEKINVSENVLRLFEQYYMMDVKLKRRMNDSSFFDVRYNA